MKILVTILFCSILISFRNFPQEKKSYKLIGVVVDSVSGTSLANVNVTIFSRKDGNIIGGSSSNEQGYFEIEKIPENIINASFSMLGYQTKIIDSISLENNSHLGLVKLNAKTLLLPEVVVVTNKPMIEFKIDKQVINVGQVPGSSGSLTDVLKNTGLVDVDPQSKSISVKGQNIRLEMDGHPYEMPDYTLSQLPASMVDQVEVILSPGARESAEGGTYILNIITKKSVFDNFNGSVRLVTSTNNRNYGGLNVNYKENELNLFGSCFAQYFGDMNSNSFLYKINYKSTGFHILNSHSSNTSNLFFGTIKSGFDYDLDSNKIITIVGSYTRLKNNYNSAASTAVENYMGMPQYNYNTISSSNTIRNNLTLYGFYKMKFDKSIPQSTLPERVLTVDAYYSNINNPSLTDLNTVYSYQAGLPLLHNSGTIENANTFIFKVEYVVPSEAGRFETGYNFTYRERQNKNNAADYSYQTGTWADSLLLSNLFKYNEDIQAAYITYSNNFGKFGVKTGLRLENLTTLGNQVTANENFRHNYLNFFPNINLSYSLSDLFQITFNAFRRVKYPELYYINPYKIYNGPNSFRAGNPDMRPYFTNSYRLSLSQYINVYHNISTGLYKYITANIQDSISYTSPVNMSSNKDYGIDISLPYYNSPMSLFQLPDFISMFNIGFTYRYSKSTGKYLNEDLSDWGYWKSFNTSVELKLWYEISASLYFNYVPGTKSKKYINSQSSYLSLFFSKSFLNDKINLNMGVDILANNVYDLQTFGTDFYLHNNSTMKNSRGISISFTYMINSYKERRDKNIDDGRDANDNSAR